MKMNSYLSSSSSSEVMESRLSRNFDELITERESVNVPINEYLSLYDVIREKLFIINAGDDIDLTQDEVSKYEEKYNTKQTKYIIKKLKEDITLVYLQKIENSVLIEENKRLYNSFCNHVLESIKSINGIKINPDKKDTELINLLHNRINSYYDELGFDKLLQSQYHINSEFEFLRKSIIELSGIVPSVCSVCMDRQVTWFINPCGHTICTECKSKTEKTNSCHYCRGPRLNFSKLFL